MHTNIHAYTRTHVAEKNGKHAKLAKGPGQISQTFAAKTVAVLAKPTAVFRTSATIYKESTAKRWQHG